MFLIIIICIILFVFLIKKNSHKNSCNNNGLVKEEKKSIETKRESIIAPFYFEVEKQFLRDLTEKQYDSLYNKFENACEKYQDSVADVEAEFTMNAFDYETRVRCLQSAIKQFDKCFQIVAPFWYEDSWFMESLELTNPDKWTTEKSGLDNPTNVFTIDEAPEEYVYMNINFLKWLLKEYQLYKDELVTFLKKKEDEKGSL